MGRLPAVVPRRPLRWARRLFAREEVASRCAQAYFETVYQDFQLLARPPAGQARPREWEVAERIEQRYQTAPCDLGMDEVLLFERAVLRLLPDDALRPKAAALREQFRAHVGEDEFRAYLAGPAPDPASAPPAAVRADAEGLLYRFQRVYAMAPFRERMRSKLAIKITNRLTLLVAVALAAYAVEVWRHHG